MTQSDINKAIEWTETYYGHLIGGTITNITLADSDDPYNPWVTLHVRAKDSDHTFKCEISMDQEGNGPGFLFGLPIEAP